MAKTAYSKQELSTIMTEVTAAVDEVLAKSQTAQPTLQKNENCAPVMKTAEGASVQDAQDKKAQGGQMTKADEDPSASSPSPAPDASASAPASPSPDASAPAAPQASPSPDASAPADPAAAAGAPTMEQLKAAYDQLSPEEKNLHMQALQASLQASAAAPQAAAPAAPPAPDASASAPAAPAPGPDAAAPMPGDQSQGVSPEFAMKSEKLQAEITDLKKSLNLALDVITTVVSQPKMKSITGEDVLNKGESMINIESMSKSELTERLNKAVKSETLSKSDRELVKGFYNNQKSRKDIAHLIK